MERRHFLVAAAAAVALRKLPQERQGTRLFLQPNGMLLPKLPPVKYKMGFQISEELLQDDLYGQVVGPAFPLSHYGQ